MSSTRVVLFSTVLLGISVACSEDRSRVSWVCDPGETQFCACPGGVEGAQRCAEDGSLWGECVCPSGTGGSLGMPDAGTTTLSGSGGDGGNTVTSGGAVIGGTGGSSMAGSGGVGATGGATGGSSGDVDVGGASSCGDSNPLLTPSDGFILDLDGSGIIGAWFTFGCPDAVVNPIEGEPVPGSNGQICFSGTAPQVIGDDYATYYGAAIGFDLCGMPGDMSTCVGWLPDDYCAWPAGSKHTASECGISLNSISFNITGTLPPELRVVFQEAARTESAYLRVNAEGCFNGSVSAATVAYRPTAPGTEAANVESIHFQVATNATAPVSWDFCISEMNIQ